MSWYPTELVKCYRCGKRFSTPIEKLSHQGNGGVTGRGCLVNRVNDNLVICKVGTWSSEALKTRNVIEVGKVITVQRHSGEKFRARVTMINESAVFLDME